MRIKLKEIEKTDQERMLDFMKEIESKGSGRFTTYDFANELKLIEERRSKLSSNQRKMVLKMYDIIKSTVNSEMEVVK